MTTSLKKKVFLFIFCLASITQGMYSTYFVSILTTIESIYQIQSKTAGALLSATEIGQIFGSLFIAYYGGRGNKPKWIAACMLLSALAALISISPHFFLITLKGPATNNDYHNQAKTTINPMTNNLTNASISSTIALTHSAYQAEDLPKLNDVNLNKQSTATYLATTMASVGFNLTNNRNHLCRWENTKAKSIAGSAVLVTPLDELEPKSKQNLELKSRGRVIPANTVIVVFFICLLAIGFGSTAITTLGIPFIDDIISKEESPLYLGLTIGLKIFGPAFGFLLGSFCIRLDLSKSVFADLFSLIDHDKDASDYGAWWLGLIIISVPLIILSIPMYYLSQSVSSNNSERDDFEDITYQAAEDHDIGGSHDFQSHMLTLAHDLDVTSNQTCFSSEIDSSSREVLQGFSHPSPSQHMYSNYVRNLTYDQPILSDEGLYAKDKVAAVTTSNKSLGGKTDEKNPIGWNTSVCLKVNHFGGLESTSFTSNVGTCDSSAEQDDQMLQHLQRPPPPSSSRSSLASSTIHSTEISGKIDPDQKRKNRKKNLAALAGLSRSLSRLLSNRLLILRMLSGILHILPIAGFYTFLPKYLIEQYRITLSSASAISGLAGILFVGFGAFLGGTIVRLLNVNSRLMTRWIAASALLYAIGMIILMNLGCTDNRIVHYISQDFVLTDCSTSCKCSIAVYDPVCANGTTYISPCLAGCKSHSISEKKIIYDECGCMSMSHMALNRTTMAVPSSDHVNLNVATQGHCRVDCGNLVWYIVVFSVFTLIHASCEVGSVMFNLRCVKSNDRTLALGLITFASSLMGTIPCSVIYGTVVDLTCVHWDTVSTDHSSVDTSLDLGASSRGACRVYDNDTFRYYLHSITSFVMLLAFIIDCMICRYADEVDFYDRSDSKADIRLGLKKSTETI